MRVTNVLCISSTFLFLPLVACCLLPMCFGLAFGHLLFNLCAIYSVLVLLMRKLLNLNASLKF